MPLRLLADENIPAEAVEALRIAGHNVLWAATDAHSASDDALLHLAQTESRIVLTFDKDFGELAFSKRLPATSGIILLRIEVGDLSHAVETVLAAVNSRTDWTGHFSVVEQDRIRMTPLPALSEE